MLGCTKTLQGHPGFPDLEITVPIGTVNGQVVTVNGKGMPKRGSSEFGNLHILVTVTVSEKDKEILQRNAPLLKAMFV